jgi:pimeloyl-ACP methyl ester carboxylesterase
VDYLREAAYEELPRVLDRHGLQDVILVGHSDGGSIALLFAARPGSVQVRAVVTEAAHLFVEEVTVEGIRRTVEMYETTDLRKRLERHHGEKADALFRAWADSWLSPEFRSFRMEAEIRQVRCPVLAIQGVEDPYGTKAQLDAIARNAAGPVELMWVPDCQHTPHREARERVIPAMTTFIAAAVPE